MARILLIDDNVEVHELVVGILSESHQVLALNNWAKALPHVFGGKMDLMLLDIEMPGIKGDKLAQGFMDKVQDRAFKIVLFSAIDPSELRQKAREIKADGYICKTFDSDLLLAKIKRYLN